MSTMLSDQLENLSPQEKRDLLARLLQKKASAAPAPIPLSHGQQSLWFLYQQIPESAAYNIAIVFKICSVVNVPALQRAFRTIQHRHPALRTILSNERGREPVQIAQAQQELCFMQIDAAGWTSEELQQHVLSSYQQPFDLENGPLFRISLFTRSAHEHVLLLTQHHIVSDFWSLLVLMAELRTLYPAECAGTPATLPTPKYVYSDFVRQQHEMLADARGQKLWEYWQQQLSGELPILNLPTDHPRPPMQTQRGASFFFQLSEELTQALKDLAQAEGVTFYMMLLAAFQVLLYRYSGQDDILIGSPMSGRIQAEFAEVVGYFVNIVALRADLSQAPPFTTFLKQVRRTALEAIEHQNYPFPLLVSNLRIPHDPSRPPLVQALFTFQQPQQFKEITQLLIAEPESKHVEWGGLELAPFELHQQEGQFDLTLEMIETSGTFAGVFKYNTDLFDETTLARMSAHFATLLRSITDAPETPVSELSLLSDDERRHMLAEWGAVSAEYPTTPCAHELFEIQAARHPDQIALVHQDKRMTYRDLNQRANRLAHYLRSSGVGPETIVGMYLERSCEMLVGILGILKAGGAYLPIDPSVPQERIAFMLTDSETPLLLTQADLLAKLPEQRPSTICLDQDWERIAQFSSANPPALAQAHNLAYVIYTSGSTGLPKGVLIEHANITRLFHATAAWFNFSDQDTWTLFHSYAFDFSVWEIWGALIYGGKLVIVPYLVSRSPETFYALLCQEQVTILNQTPSAFQQLLHVEESRGTIGELALRFIIFGGEALNLPAIRPWFRRHGDQSPQLVNMYGITETTVHVTYRPLRRHDADEARGSVIGIPIPDVQLYILDHHQQIVPPGVPGELYVGGAGVARGYLNRRELTEERFIRHPFDDNPEARLYKTGDSGRYLADHDIEYLGRLDSQVQIRGFRVELGEIEATLIRHPDIKEAVLIARETPDNVSLIAYWVPAPNCALTISELREFLKTRLPDYMLPTAFVPLDAIPLTANGKVDRHALPEPDKTRAHLDRAYIAPRNPAEQAVAAIWTEVLGMERIGMTDDFFEIGGHSLLAVQAISRIRQHFQVNIPLRDFLEHPTIADLVSAINRLARPQPSQPAIEAIQPALRTDEPLPLSFSQKQMWILSQIEAQNIAYNMPAALRLNGSLHLPALEQSLREIIRRHEILRTTFPDHNGTPIQQIAPELALSLPVIDLCGLSCEAQEAEIQRRMAEEGRRPFDLGNGPLFRLSVLKLGETAHVVLVVFHHIIFDGWSIGVLTHELMALYEAFSDGRPSPLPELPIQYADFAYWQQQQVHTDAFKRHLEYWKQTLSGELPVPQLPFDHPRPATPSFQGAVHPARCCPQRVEALKALGQHEKATLFMVVLAAFKILLYRYTHQEDVIVGTPTANRNRPELEALLGYFINPVALRTDLSGNPTIREVIRRIRDRVADSQEYQDVPFEQIVSALHIERAWGANPVFQAVLAWQKMPASELRLPGLTLEIQHAHTRTAKFDLYLELQETEEGLSGMWEYNTDLFEPATIQRINRHFERILDAMIADADSVIAEIPLLTEDEQRQVLETWNATATEYPRSACIHQLFEAQAARTPDALAVVDQRRHLTYAQLNGRANQLAHYLREHGVGPGEFVGVYLERSAEMVVSVLAILKAGGAYVPLDPAYPRDRLEFIIQDAHIQILIAQAAFAGDFAAISLQDIVCLDRDWDGIASLTNQGNPALPVSPQEIIYALYTSGSTGKPKGVLIRHQSVTNYVWWAKNQYTTDTAKDFPLFSSLSFDLTVTSLFTPLICGGRLVIYREERVGDRDLAVLNVFEDNQVDIVKLTPAHLAFLQSLHLADARIGTLILGGEDLKTEIARTTVERFAGKVRILNEYGPTEATVGCMLYQFDPERDTSGSVPIGTPAANVQLYILDPHLNPVPIGVMGELYIAGDGLAQGYLNRPDLTEERFVANPFRPGARMYRTGDLARWRADGQMQFFGRLDHQIKLRGFRIELGEIEAELSAHEHIREAVVVVAHQTSAAPLAALPAYCSRCGMPSNYPGLTFDRQGVCSMCRDFERYHDKVMPYFKTLADLRTLFDHARAFKPGEYDCLVLFSGGKDSTYMLYQLVGMGLKVLTFTLDNGYLFQGAKDNIRRIVDDLQIDHIFGTVPNMAGIFRESLHRYSNVCQSCFKALYTLSMNLAYEKKIPYIVTGLSRGQLFETRLGQLSPTQDFDPDAIDRAVLDARKIYHRIPDVISHELDTSLFQDEAFFEQVKFVDFYRYTAVTQAEIYEFLAHNVPWMNPSTAGCTSNCLINDVGIHVHTCERGFHNYALPNSWEVRLGHMSREASIADLESQPDMPTVTRILQEIGYQERETGRIDYLAAYYVADTDIAGPQLRAYLQERLPEYMIPSVFVRLDKMPLTPNGKIDRRALPKPDRAENLREETYVPPVTPTEKALAQIWADVLRLPQVGIRQNFFDSGGDSILGIQIVARANQAGIRLTPTQLFQHQTIAELAAVAGTGPAIAAEQGAVTGPVELLPVQRWFFDLNLPNPHHWNQALLLTTPPDVDPGLLEQALRQLQRHHDSLRLRFAPAGDTWQQTCAKPDVDVPLDIIALSGGLTAAESAHAIAEHATAIQAGLNIAQGPLFRAAYFHFKSGDPGRLLLVIHHLAIDGVSWRILLQDLQILYQQLQQHTPLSLPAKTTSVQAWASRLAAHAQSAVIAAEYEYWTALAPTQAAPPLDGYMGTGSAAAEASSADVVTTLPVDETFDLLHNVNHAYNTRIDDVLLTALVQAFGQMTGRDALFLALESHGRADVFEDVDISRTVGWFTTIFPAHLTLDDPTNPGDALKSIKAQLRRIPNYGIGYGLLRYMPPDDRIRAAFRQFPTAAVSFNYLGQIDQEQSTAALFSLANEPIGPSHDPAGPRAYQLDVVGRIQGQQLRMEWTYSRNDYQRDAVERLARTFQACLRVLIAHCRNLETSSYTPSDFPDVELSQEQLDDILDAIDFGA